MLALSIKERIDIVLLSGRGLTQSEVAEEFSRMHPDRPPISRATVGNLLTKFRQTGSVYSKPRWISYGISDETSCW
ncbi:hypothetical protein KIN20_026096 [Parelaphostrongylus tenuis]|uniref:DUF4817 domain-containing protein n=1 Tax=Parelaphostrongylus tenuis TaxID=148309 RepID=A0AAD5NB70_PARTN|nr:hypothetical protein KIN20_026096 [Parelaphostrongylus tenuis]